MQQELLVLSPTASLTGPKRQAFITHVSIPGIFYSRSLGSDYLLQQLLKRIMDIVSALSGLIILSPFMIFIAALIKFTSDGPVLYKSLRIGKNQKPFYMYKFRTMYPDADRMREELRRKANLEGNLFKLPNDPRITPIGRVLRTCSLDELPQLINILMGDMSLVGPRPLPPDESNMFKSPYNLRFHILPGVTGLWQVSGRSRLSFDQLCQLELSYVLSWNLWKDLKIILKTFPVVLRSHGAY